MPVQPGLWSGSDAYERYMGRWSRRLAPRFLDWIDAAPGLRWIDVGCGTGALASAVLGACDPSQVTGIDSAPAFLDAGQGRQWSNRREFPGREYPGAARGG